MVELEKDVRSVEIKEGRVFITRETTESYDAEEYLRLLNQQQLYVENTEKGVEETKKLLELLNSKRPEVEAIREQERAKVKEEIDYAMEKEKNDKKSA